MDYTGALTWAMAADVGAKLGSAALIAGLLAAHPLRLRRQLRDDFDWDLVRAQVLIATAGALMVIVVGDSVARAFGLVGIGSFVRFRTVVKNPRDTAVLFLLIGLGMACGMKLYALAACGAAFLFLLLFVVELGPVKKEEKKEPPLPDDEDL